MRTKTEIRDEILALETCLTWLPIHRRQEVRTQIDYLCAYGNMVQEGWQARVSNRDRWVIREIVRWLQDGDSVTRYWQRFQTEMEREYVYVRSEPPTLQQVRVTALDPEDARERGWYTLGDLGFGAVVMDTVIPLS